MQRSMSVAGRSLATQFTPLGVAVSVPSARASILKHRYIRPISRAAIEAATSAAVYDELRRGTPANTSEAALDDATYRGGKQSDRRSNQRKDGNRDAGGSVRKGWSARQPETRDRALVKERSQLLLKGEAVGLTMVPTPADLTAGFKGLRPLAKALRAEHHTLLFFPSTRLVKPEKPSAAPSAESGEEKLEQEQQQRQQQQQQEKQPSSRMLDLALVAVPAFQKPEAEVTIRVGAKSKPDVIARTLTRALLRSSSVAVRAAGPTAALVALQAAAQARRAIGAEQQLDLAFSIEYLRVPATEANKADEEAADAASAVTAAVAAAEAATAAVTAAVTAAEAATEAPSEKAGAGFAAMASVLQFSFYKRELPTPEVLVSDFAPTRSGPAMCQLLASLVAERREVDLVLDSGDALFAVQALNRVVRDSWTQNKASVGVFLASLEYYARTASDAAADGGDGAATASAATSADAEAVDEGNDVRFKARLQLRRIPGAPNLVPTGGERKSMLGAPVGIVKWDSPIGPLGGAMSRELYSAGIFSLWPQEGVCVARVLRALWQAQQARVATTAAAPTTTTVASPDADAATSSDAAAATAAPPAAAASSPLAEIAIIPELQDAGFLPEASESRDDGRSRRRRDGAARSQRATVLHLLDVSPLLTSTLRSKEGRVVPISGGEQLHQLLKAVVLRNRMYGNRPDGKLLTLRPLLDDSGALAMRFQYIDSSVVAEIPPPPEGSRSQSKNLQPAVAAARPSPPPSPSAVAEEEGGYATDDEFGLGAEAAVLVPAAAAAAAAAAGAAATSKSDAGGKSPWIMFVTSNTSSMRLAMGIVAETCKPYDRRCPVWLRVRVLSETIAAAALSVAMAQAQVQERANVELLVVPALERKRDNQNRPFNALTWQLIKYGPGAERGAAAAAAAAAMTTSSGQMGAGPSPAAMAAAAAAAAKVRTQGDALLGGTRKLW